MRCRTSLRSTFLPAPAQDWDIYPALSELMPMRSRGVTAGRSWVYAPTPEILRRRWRDFLAADVPRRRDMFKEKSRRAIDQVLPPLPGFPRAAGPLASETGPCPEPVQVAYRSFDRQWLIPDKRLLAEARTALWQVRSEHQIYVSEQDVQKIETGPGLLFAALIPDIDHFSGWGGSGAHPLWRDRHGTQPNFAPGLLNYLNARLDITISPVDLLAYIAGVVAHPAYTARFGRELQEPGIRVPLSTEPQLWESAINLGRHIIWLHTYGTRCHDAAAGRPEGERAIIEQYGVKCTRAVRSLPDRLPDHLIYDESTGTLHIGEGEFSPVPRRAAEYDVSRPPGTLALAQRPHASAPLQEAHLPGTRRSDRHQLGPPPHRRTAGPAGRTYRFRQPRERPANPPRQDLRNSQHHRPRPQRRGGPPRPAHPLRASRAIRGR